jgi:molecular chaperone DnaJ
VRPDAGNDEIKKAYRQLSRIYHPDANINNPNKKQAEAKFKEVQEAYNQIVKEREQGIFGDSYGGRGSYGNQGAYGGASGGWTSEETIRFQAVQNYLNAGHYQEALHVLGTMADRSALWFYCSAIANSGVGNNILALDHARRASAMEPSNMEYQVFLSRLESGGQWYRETGSTYRNPVGNIGNCCWEIALINIFCNCCCRPF